MPCKGLGCGNNLPYYKELVVQKRMRMKFF
jgi:hypothetical protein